MTPPRWVFQIGWFLDDATSRLSGGRVILPNPSRGKLQTLFLRSTGRTTGRIRRNGLYFFELGPDLVVVASNGGEDDDPAWWSNLRAQPEAEVELGTKIRRVRARQATAEEAAPLYERFVEAIPLYDAYRRRTTRHIPVVILEPR